jgi:hypothetical protein
LLSALGFPDLRSSAKSAANGFAFPITAIPRDSGDYLALTNARPIPPTPSTSLISPASFMRFSVL